MSKSRSGAPKRMAVGLLAGAISVVGLALAPPAGAVEDVEVERLAGATRYGTAAAIAGEDPPGAFTGADTAILATGENFPDALAASGLAGENAPAPILLTRTAELSPEALAALDELAVENVIIVGGTAAVSDDVESTLEDEGFTVSRVAGTNRYATAAAIADESGTPTDGTVIIATGTNYPDALAGGPLAYAGGHPILLVTPTDIPAETEDALEGATGAVILGGTAAVSTAVEEEIEEITGNAAVRLAGVNRYETAEAVADHLISNEGFDGAEVLLASGLNFPDALAGGPLGGELEAPIILTGSCPSAGWLEDNTDTIETLYGLGGTAAQTDATLAECEAAAEGGAEEPVSDADFDVTDGGAQLLEFDADGTGNEAHTVTFSGLDNTKEYHVVLFPVNEGGQEDSVYSTSGGWTFRDYEGSFDGIADDDCETSDGYAEIRSINGENVDSQCDYDVEPEDGELEVRLDNDSSAEADSAFLVVWEDTSNTGASDDELDLDASDRPEEPFGIAGPFTWTGGECLSGTDVYGDILWINKDANSFIADQYDCTAIYDSADSYYYDYEYSIPMADWEDWVNNGDYVETYTEDEDENYSRTSPNNWMLDSDYVGTPLPMVTATTGDFDDAAGDTAANDVKLTWPEPLNVNMDEDSDEDAEYCIDRYLLNILTGVYTNLGTVDCFGWSDDTDESNEAMEDREFVAENEGQTPSPAHVYAYALYVESATGSGNDYSDPSNGVSPAQATGGPKSISATSQDDGDGKLENADGDTLTLIFDQGLDAAGANDSVTVADADGTTCTLSGATGDTFTYFSSGLGPANDGIVISVVSLSCSAAGTTGGLQLPATATATSGIKDFDSALTWDLAGSLDKVFE